MKLENYGVQELTESEMQEINGGSLSFITICGGLMILGNAAVLIHDLYHIYSEYGWSGIWKY